MLIDYAQIVYDSMIEAGIISARGKFQVSNLGGFTTSGGLVETEYVKAIRRGLLLNRQPKQYRRRGNLEKSGFGYSVTKHSTSLDITVYSNASPNVSLKGSKAGKQMSLYFPGAGLYMYERMHLWVAKGSMWKSIAFEPINYIKARAVTESANNEIQKRLFGPSTGLSRPLSSIKGTPLNRLHTAIQKRLIAAYSNDKVFKELLVDKIRGEAIKQLLK